MSAIRKRLLEILDVAARPLSAREIFDSSNVRWHPEAIDTALRAMARDGALVMRGGGRYSRRIHGEAVERSNPGQPNLKKEDAKNSAAKKNPVVVRKVDDGGRRKTQIEVLDKLIAILEPSIAEVLEGVKADLQRPIVA